MPGNSDRFSLFRDYPGLQKALPKYDLGTFPTPIHPLEKLNTKNLWVKRDDQSSLIYGGSKIRKLEFILAAACRRSARHLLTLGGIGTHHGLATAIFCDRLAIQCTLLLFYQPVNKDVRRNLLLLGQSKARLIYHKTLLRVIIGYYSLYRMRFPTAFFVYPGGSNAIGNTGFVNAAFELKDQIDRGIAPEPEVIFCPLGSGGSLAGLALGAQLTGLNSRIIGVRVMPSHLGPFQACTLQTVEKQMKRTYAYLKKKCRELPDISIRMPLIEHNYVGDGYGALTRAGKYASQLMLQHEGITLESTYTAKTFAAVLDYCRKHQSNRGPVLYWHTYNSVDLSKDVQKADLRNLPPSLQGFITPNPDKPAGAQR